MPAMIWPSFARGNPERWLALLVLCLAGAAWAQSPREGSPAEPARSAVYTPGEPMLRQLSEDQARRRISEMAQERGLGGLYIAPHTLGLGVAGVRVRSVDYFDDRIDLRVDDRGNPLRSFPFRGMPATVLISDTVFGIAQFGVPLDQHTALYYADGGLSSDSRRQGATRLADALYVLRHHRLEDDVNAGAFQQVVARYRALMVKPDLPEEVRKFRVQAEFAAGQKLYDQAVRFYAEGLKIAPWWAQGHFNRALLLAELGRFRDAASSMGRYVMLEPGAPDARAAQDKIYQWEAMTQREQTPAPARAGGIVATTSGSEDCFIATAAYGSPLDPHVGALRRFRDRWLMTNAAGQEVVRFYYRHSPPLAKLIADDERLRILAQVMLAPLVWIAAFPQETGFALCVLITICLPMRRLRRRGSPTARREHGLAPANRDPCRP